MAFTGGAWGTFAGARCGRYHQGMSRSSIPLVPAFLTPVAALTRDGEALTHLKLVEGRSLADVDDSVVATLVRLRLRLARGQGWALISTFGATFAAGLALPLVIGHGVWLGGAIAIMGSLACVLGFLVERGAWRLFARIGRRDGLSDEACQRIYARAPDAEAWIAVLHECGRVPADAELACFVRPSTDAVRV